MTISGASARLADSCQRPTMTNPRFIGILVFCIPAFILVVPGGGEVAFGILAVLGVTHAIKNRTHPLAEPSTRFISLICWAFLLKRLYMIRQIVCSPPSSPCCCWLPAG